MEVGRFPIRHRLFTLCVVDHQPNRRLLQHIPKEFPFKRDYKIFYLQISTFLVRATTEHLFRKWHS